MIERERILKSLGPLFIEARESGLWFYSAYQGLWLAPEELRAYQACGQYLWGADNWQLRNPKILLDQAEQAVETAMQRLESVRARLRKAGVQ